MSTQFSVERLIMQPTQLCNLNCTYCYLPDRDKNRRMTPVVAKRVADGVSLLTNPNPIEVIWHGGEPLSCGSKHFESLVLPFEQLRQDGRITHAIQTNATLINENWCSFFKKYQFRVGVSLDGPEWANVQRVGWNGCGAFRKIMNGIDYLKDVGVPFSLIAVISQNNLNRARELYDFFVDVGCASLGVNIEEQLGVHTVQLESYDAQVMQFWKDLFLAWQANPAIKMRDFARILPSLAALEEGIQDPSPEIYDIFPSVAWNGDVVLLAPEFLNTDAPHYDNFIVGNVTRTSLPEIVQQGQQASYVQDFVSGVSRCKTGCEYFALCFGGQAGNKFFEHGTTDETETAYCRNTEKMLAEAILCSL